MKVEHMAEQTIVQVGETLDTGSGSGRATLRPPGMATLFAVAFAAAGWGLGLRQLGDNSFLWHLRTGHWILDHGIPRTDPYSFTAGGTRWVAQSWLAEVLYAGVDRLAGPFGLRLVGAALGAVIGFATYRLALRLAKDRVTATLITLPALVTTSMLWVMRPLFLGLLCMLALVWIVECPESWVARRPLVVLPIVMWLWVNLHGSFALGFGFLALHLSGRWLDGVPPWRARELRLMQGALLAFALCFVNPYGASLVTFPIHLLSRGDLLAKVAEWQSPAFREPLGIAFGLWVAVFIGVLALARKRPTRRDVVVALPFLLIAFWAQRNVLLAPLAGLPVLCRVLVTPRHRPGDRSPVAWLLLALIILSAGLVTVRAAGQPDFELTRAYPVEAMKTVEQRGLLGRRLLTTDAWGGYTIHRYWPRQRVFFDDRYDMYPLQVSRDYLSLWNTKPGWSSVLARHRIEVVVWPVDDALTALLSLDPSWQHVHSDKMAAVFVRNP